MTTYYPMRNGILKVTFRKLEREKCIRINCNSPQTDGYFCPSHKKRK